MPDKIPSFPFKLSQGADFWNVRKDLNLWCFIFKSCLVLSSELGMKPITERLDFETRCRLPDAILMPLEKVVGSFVFHFLWIVAHAANHCCPVWEPLVVLPCFFLAFYGVLSQKCHCCDVENKDWMLHSKLVPCFYRKKKKREKNKNKKRVVWRIGLTLIYLISL